MMLLSACASKPGYTMYDGPPSRGNYSPLYIQGWQHGCQTGAASSANNVFQYRRLFEQDWRLAQNDEYHRGWKDAFTYCRKQVLQESL